MKVNSLMIDDYQREHRITGAELAKLIGVCNSTISRTKSLGTCNPTTAQRLARLMQTPLEQLIKSDE